MNNDETILAQLKALQAQFNSYALINAPIKDHYTTDEFAALKGLKPKTVRDYCWLGMLKGTKQRKRWVIPREELLRYEREGLLSPLRRE